LKARSSQTIAFQKHATIVSQGCRIALQRRAKQGLQLAIRLEPFDRRQEIGKLESAESFDDQLPK